jgi:hypothetical protein
MPDSVSTSIERSTIPASIASPVRDMWTNPSNKAKADATKNIYQRAGNAGKNTRKIAGTRRSDEIIRKIV